MAKVVALLALILILTSIGLSLDFYHAAEGNEFRFFTEYNLSNVARRSALLSIYAVGVGIVIIAGGIDLSLGSVIAFTGYLSAMFLSDYGMPTIALFAIIPLVGMAIGLIHGFLVAYCRLQPFVATLCGLLCYRGLARVISGDRTGSLGDQFEFVKSLTNGELLGIPTPVWLALAVAVVAHVFLSLTIWGRYIYAIGNNEEASLYSGINVKLTKVLTYVICSFLGACSGMLEASYIGSITPSGTGAFYELYAIAAAVLGGCSLRGGEGMVIGMVLGAVTIRLIGNVTNLMEIPSQWEYLILGLVILTGALVDAIVEQYRHTRSFSAPTRAPPKNDGG